MNAAAKVMNYNHLFNGHFAHIRVTKSLYFQIVLMILILFSAIAVVYSTNLYRMTFSQLEAAQQQTHQLQLRWGQLLLEQASLATPARVQKLAKDKLHMVVPLNHQTVIVRVK